MDLIIHLRILSAQTFVQLVVPAPLSIVEAAFWLIGGNHFEQALVMLDNAIELVLKGELERIHRILIADTKSLDFQVLKSLLKDSFRQHPSGKTMPIPDFDIERTIYFDAAFDRVAELYPSITKRWRQRLIRGNSGSGNAVHELRNEIVNDGGDETQRGQYVAAIVEVALPFLEEILALITQHEESPVDLSKLLMEWIYREVAVAQAVLKTCEKNGLPPAVYAIAPLAHHIVWSHTRWPSPQDDLDVITHDLSDDWTEYAARQKYPKGWDTELTVEVTCPICGSMSPSQSYVPAKVLVEEEPLDRKLVVPEGFQCFGFLSHPRNDTWLNTSC